MNRICKTRRRKQRQRRFLKRQKQNRGRIVGKAVKQGKMLPLQYATNCE